MSTPKDLRPPSAPASPDSNATTVRNHAFAEPSGRVTHDERGNAVWEWFKQSTSRLLRKLEMPEAEVQAEHRRASGGYDPYNQARAPRKPKKK